MSDLASRSMSVLAAGPFAPGHLGELTHVVPFELVDAVLAEHGGRERRVRLLPSRVVVYLLLAGALFEHLGWLQVWDRLTSSLSGRVKVSGSALCEAMRRVGVAPIRGLFDVVKGATATTASQTVSFAGRLVVAIDGTQFAVPDSPANTAVLPKAKGGPNGPPGYPMVRLVAIVVCGTRAVIDAVFGTDQVSELAYAAALVAGGGLRPGMLLLGDRNFATRDFATAVQEAGADFLMRIKHGPRALRLPAVDRLPDGSYLSIMAGVKVRVIEARIQARTADGDAVTGGTYRLVTTLLDPDQAPAIALIRLYHDRWEIETTYAELKSTLLAGRVLRSRTPTGIDQEIWAMLTAYQVLRTAMSDALLATPHIDPDRASFTIAINTARDQIIKAADVIASSAIELVGEIGAAILARLLPERRTRTAPRIVKRAISKHRATTRDPDRRSHPVTIEITVLTPPGTA